MSDHRNAMLSILADAQKQMHQRRVQGLIRSKATGGAVAASAPAASTSSSSALTTDVVGVNTTLGGRVRSLDYIGARDNRGEFFDVWSRRIEAFVNDSTQTNLDLPDELDSNDRRVLHSLAEKFNLAHVSAGKGTDRHLVLKKDALFFKAANKIVDHDAIEALKNKKEAAHGSRFHLRRVQHNNNNPSGEGALLIGNGDDYDDDYMPGGVRKDTRMEKALAMLDAATNQFANAVDGNAAPLPPHQQRAAALPLTPALSEANKYLSRNAAASNGSTSANTASNANTVAVPSAWANAMSRHKTAAATSEQNTSSTTAAAAAAAGLRDIVTYEEQCTSCGASSVLDYDKSQWTCIGYCDGCKREAVFRLAERRKRVVVAAPAAAATAPAPPANAPLLAAGQKRPREEGAEDVSRATAESAAATTVITRAESIEKEEEAQHAGKGHKEEEIVKEDASTAVGEEEDDGEELIPLEVDDLVSMFECNDHDPSFVGWVRSFAVDTLRSDPLLIGSRVLFVMDLADTPSKGPQNPIASSSSSGSRVFCKLTASPDAMASLVDELWSCVFDKNADVIIALPNMSVGGGMEVEMIFHGPSTVAEKNGDALASLRQKLGSNHFVSGTTLKSVV